MSVRMITARNACIKKIDETAQFAMICNLAVIHRDQLLPCSHAENTLPYLSDWIDSMKEQKSRPIKDGFVAVGLSVIAHFLHCDVLLPVITGYRISSIALPNILAIVRIR